MVFFSLIGIDGEKLTYCFLVSETIVALLGIFYLFTSRKQLHMTKTGLSVKELLWFGVRILPSNAVLELNTKIDVICLLLLLHNESLVGVYSFAAMFAEGFYQLLMVLRKIINPHITIEFSKGKLEEYIESFKRRYVKSMYALSFLAYFMLLAGYYILVNIIGKEGYYAGTVVLAVVCACIVINTKMIVFGNALSQTGNPGIESMVNILATATNAFLNIVFISSFGMIGGAIATGLSYFVFSIIQKHCFKMRTGIVL